MSDEDRIEELESRLSELYSCGKNSYENPDYWLSEVDEILAKLSELRSKPGYKEWPRPIPVSERLPEKGEVVLAINSSSKVPMWSNACLGSDAQWHREALPPFTATHWLPLPPAPKD